MRTGRRVTSNNFLDFYCFQATMTQHASIETEKFFALIEHIASSAKKCTSAFFSKVSERNHRLNRTSIFLVSSLSFNLQFEREENE
jgi:hypothetical protein